MTLPTAAALASARTLLFVPADRPQRLAKALAAGADLVIADLEDAVAPDQKAEARTRLAECWPSLSPDERARVLVRINAHEGGWNAEDETLMRRLATQGLRALVCPKSETASSLAEAARWPGIEALLPLVESAVGLRALDALAVAPKVVRLAFGHLDFQTDLGMFCSADERELDAVRFSFVLASRVAGLVPPVDGVTVALDDEARLRADAERARRMGFGAKLCIHPRQVGVVQAALGPAPDERAWAQRVLQASAERGEGAFRFEGRMVDAPVLALARRWAGGI